MWLLRYNAFFDVDGINSRYVHNLKQTTEIYLLTFRQRAEKISLSFQRGAYVLLYMCV